MHTLLITATLLIVTCVGICVLWIMRRMGRWRQRRMLQLLVLAIPLVSLEIALHGFHDLTSKVCFVDIPPWGYLLDIVVPVVMSVMAIGALGAGILRVMLLTQIVRRSGAQPDPLLQAHMNRLALGLMLSPPQVVVCAYTRPLALTYGVWRPTVLLSRGIIAQLDDHELEAVLAHELGHVARRDYLVMWFATVLRNMFWYVPTSWRVYKQIQQEKEFAADDVAISATRRPLALASALATIWQQTMHGLPSTDWGQAFLSSSDDIEGRIKRLLTVSKAEPPVMPSRGIAADIGSVVLITLVIISTSDSVLMALEPLECVPVFTLLLMIWGT